LVCFVHLGVTLTGQYFHDKGTWCSLFAIFIAEELLDVIRQMLPFVPVSSLTNTWSIF
jgi:hypothetical protein